MPPYVHLKFSELFSYFLKALEEKLKSNKKIAEDYLFLTIQLWSEGPSKMAVMVVVVWGA
jgi:hypothetical protein